MPDAGKMRLMIDYQDDADGLVVADLAGFFARLDGIYMVDTCCDDELVPFYERFGMRCGVAMMRRDFSAQSGRLE